MVPYCYCYYYLLHGTAAAAQVQQETRIGAIMIDSPQLIPHAAALRRACGVPVFESLTALHCCSAARRVSLLPAAAERGRATVARDGGPLSGAPNPSQAPCEAGGEREADPGELEPSEALRRVLAGGAPLSPAAMLVAHSSSVMVAAGATLRVPFFVAQARTHPSIHPVAGTHAHARARAHARAHTTRHRLTHVPPRLWSSPPVSSTGSRRNQGRTWASACWLPSRKARPRMSRVVRRRPCCI